ncbi:hypothetical protein B0H14DRAFT_3138431 [Mycena olivaceomarginata]|nr:hypothetical protein B0H14DRAFT_3138431 [Mycena olivaceomarginata]
MFLRIVGEASQRLRAESRVVKSPDVVHVLLRKKEQYGERTRMLISKSQAQRQMQKLDDEITLHKIYTFIKEQQDGKTIKQFFRNNETSGLLRDCTAGLAHAQEVFEIGTNAAIFNDVRELRSMGESMHEELLELVQTFSDGSTISDSSFVYSGGNELNRFPSSNSFSMLPSKPKIFHGRESELEDIMRTLCLPSARIAILGGGGMGKTSLARAVLHHPDTSLKFQHTFFVSAEPATNSIELAALIGLHLGLNPGQDLTKPVVQHLSRQPSCLLILDNLETVWEPMESRVGTEELLSLLTEIEQLAVVITMRGGERPGKVRWTHPFLRPLQPLSDDAALQTFVDITDDSYDSKDIQQLLLFTDNMPLAVNLIAHAVDFEGLSTVLARWEADKTALLSAGHDRKSNLDASISLSVSSPRITPGSKELLSLLSILPDGISDLELVQINLPIRSILTCKAELLATALAYQDDRRRLRSLMPVREHVQHFFPPSQILTQKYRGEQLQPIVNQINQNLGNLQEVLKRGLQTDNPNLVDTSYSIARFQYFDDQTLAAKFYAGAAYYFIEEGNLVRAMQFSNQALELARLSGDTYQQCTVMATIAHLTLKTGDFRAARTYCVETQKLAKLSGSLYEEARALWTGARCSMFAGNYSGSINQVKIARHNLELCGMSGGALDKLISGCQAEIHLQKSEYAEARHIYRQVLETASAELNPAPCAFALLNIAEVDSMIGGSQEVLENLENAKAVFTNLQYPLGIIACDMILAKLELREGKFASANTLLNESLNSCWGKDTQFTLYCLEGLADITQWTPPDVHSGFKWPVIFLAYAHKSQKQLALHKALLFLGDIFSCNADWDTASNLYTVGLAGFTYMDVHRGRAQCLLRLGDLANRQGHSTEANTFWQTARPLFERSLQARDVAQIDKKLAEAVVAAVSIPEPEIPEVENGRMQKMECGSV